VETEIVIALIVCVVILAGAFAIPLVFIRDPFDMFRLPKMLALRTEAILIALLAAGTCALTYAPPIAGGITLLLITVAFSYRQTIIAYPQGGGTYIVSRENLGTIPSLVAASSLLIDYVLTVAVSMSAAVAAITSAVGVLDPYRVQLAIALIALVTLANLRGLKESGQIFAIPNLSPG